MCAVCPGRLIGQSWKLWFESLFVAFEKILLKLHFVNSDQDVRMYLTLWPSCLCVNQSYYRTHIAMSCTLKDSSLKDESSWIFVISAPPPCLLALPAQRFCRLMSGGSGRGLGDRRWCLLPTLKSPNALTHSSTQLFIWCAFYILHCAAHSIESLEMVLIIVKACTGASPQAARVRS